MTLPKPIPPRLTAVLALLMAAAPAAAQTGPTPPVRTAVPPAQDTVRTLPQQGQADAERAQGPLLDAPVSRTEYRLGPGDQVDVAIFGELNQVYTLTVSPEGSLLIPTVGIARVLGLNLEQAEDRVRATVARYYRNVEVRLALSRVRTFKVFLVGDVTTPGVRTATAATRISEIVNAPRDRNGARRRTVYLRRASGDSVDVDLARFFQLGDVAANPTLREGDALRVPLVDETVSVQGRVLFDGAYQFRRGESLAELLHLANGGDGFPADAADSIRVVRTPAAGERVILLMSRDEALGARGRAFALQPFDAVYVPSLSNFRRQQVAQVVGQVVRPGTYPIRPDTTTVRELVAMAGGFTPQASLVQATLQRGEQTGAVPSDQLASIPTDLLTGEERRILQIRAQGATNAVVIDFQRVFAAGGDAYDQTVRSGDVLTVPMASTDVTVIGAVGVPGLVRHAPDQGVAYYVRQAGGFSRRADRGDMVVLKARNGTRVHWRDVGELDPGDTVVVPFRDDRNWRDVLTSTQAIVTTISGLVLIAVGIF
ncbi:MAG TPA: SLBB domain-containing protein [Longimicrobium sp.]|nr:SLBB domain-containing protein [Longimicrobium sp.]